MLLRKDAHGTRISNRQCTYRISAPEILNWAIVKVRCSSFMGTCLPPPYQARLNSDSYGYTEWGLPLSVQHEGARCNTELTMAQAQPDMVRETEAPAQWERAVWAADGGVGICGVLGPATARLKLRMKGTGLARRGGVCMWRRRIGAKLWGSTTPCWLSLVRRREAWQRAWIAMSVF